MDFRLKEAPRRVLVAEIWLQFLTGVTNFSGTIYDSYVVSHERMRRQLPRYFGKFGLE
jgi:hypothetical protein